MRIIFIGSGELACPMLKALLDNHADSVVAVVTQPDRPSGRRLHLTPCPVKAFVAGRGLNVMAAENASAPDVVDKLARLSPDLMIVVDFGQFLKKNLLALPPKGAINVHPSLLPKYRGAAPIQWAIANGDTETGVSVLYVTGKMDAGDLILQDPVAIHDDDTSLTLEPKLAEVGARLLTKSMVVIRNRIRGFVAWPGCFCEVPDGSGHMLRVLRARVEPARRVPGMVLELSGDGPLVACGENALRLLGVQPEGKTAMSGAAYLNGHKMKIGELLG